jgi:hypothetical protein
MNWIMVSWVFVAILTAINVFFFFKVIYPAMNMMKGMGGMPGMGGSAGGSPDMAQMMAQAQKMMAGMNGGAPGKKGAQGTPDMNALMGQMNNPNMQAQMKKAMDMLAQMQKNQKR